MGNVSNKAILVVSFGTSHNDTRAVTIDAIEKKIDDEFGEEYDVRSAFTAQFIINKLAKRDGLEIDNVKQAMDKLVADGVATLIVQPTHVMHGIEYDSLVETVGKYKDKFTSIVIGEPLLTSHEDYAKVIDIIRKITADKNKEGSAIVLMGHGTEHFANSTYACFESHLKHEIGRNYFVGTVEGYPTIKEVISDLKETDVNRVVLYPFMIVAGDHANNDMAGDEEDSWASQLKNNGYEVESVIRGLGEYEGVQSIYIEHVKAAIERSEN